MKLSGDIGAAIALKGDGGTTCSATSTLVFSALAGIKVRPNAMFFVTCFSLASCILSLGGVHRAGQYSKLSIRIIQHSG